MGTTRMDEGRSLVFGVFFAMLLGMHQSLYISKKRLDKTVNENIAVSCRDEENITRQVTWTKHDGTVLTNASRPSVKFHPKVGWLITFEHAQPSDSGIYMCSLKNEVESVHIKVIEPVDLYANASQFGKEGEDGLIKCSGTGGNLTIYQGSTTFTEGGKGRYRKVKEGLKIKNLTRNDTGPYICRVHSTSSGDMKEQTINFVVQHKPILLEMAVMKYGRLNGTTNLECAVEAEPPPTFTWYRNASKGEKEVLKNVVREGPHKSVAVIEINSDGDFGFDYVCEARNKFGKEVVIFSLEKGDKSAPADPPRLVEVGSEEVRLELHAANTTSVPVQKDMEPKGFYVEYRPKNQTGNWTWRQFDAEEDDIYELDGLQPETEYEIRVATWNLAGPGDFSDVLEVQTVSGAGRLVASSLSGYVLVNFLVIFLNPRRLLW